MKDYQRVYNDPEMKELNSSNATLPTYSKAESHPEGKRTLEVTNRRTDTTYTIEFQIVEENSRPILGDRAIQRMQLITVNNHNIITVENSSHMLTMLEIESKFSDVFAGDGRLEGQVHLAVNSEATPVQLLARKPPVALKEKFKEELQRLVEKEIIARHGTNGLDICIPSPAEAKRKAETLHRSKNTKIIFLSTKIFFQYKNIFQYKYFPVQKH